MSKVLFFVSPTLNALADKRKGTAGNKIDCAFQHYKNSTISNIQIGACIGAAALAGRNAALKSINAAVQNGAKQPGFLKTVIECVKKAPTPVKVVTGALAGISLLYRTYKKGTIEQKYIDRAQFVDHTFTPDNPNALPDAYQEKK